MTKQVSNGVPGATATVNAKAAASLLIVREAATQGGCKIGFARLNAEKALNSLSLDMIRALDAQLQRWARDEDIACVVLEGSGEKAFCAGGDIRAMHYASRKYPGDAANPEALAFFSEEYRLDYRIHRFPKPMLVWGSGIVMGGGLGLMIGASHRVVTETSRVAMPEISIGLFPDVGGSWFLRRMPGRSGLFVALTGTVLDAYDARYAGVADHLLSSGQRHGVFDRLLAAPWHADAALDRVVLTQLLQEFEASPSAAPVGNLQRHAAAIDRLCAGSSLAEVVHSIEQCAGDDAWLQRGVATLKAGSPTSLGLIWALRHKAENMPLNDVFRLELIVALQCCAHADFAEGVRALLIDKDHAPRWTPPILEGVTPQWVAQHLAEPAWPDSVSPLADL